MKDYSKLKKDELKKILIRKKIKFPPSAKKDELIKILMEAERRKKKPVTKAKAQKPTKIKQPAKKSSKSIKTKTIKKVAKASRKIKKSAIVEKAVSAEITPEETIKQSVSESYIRDEIEKYHSLPDFKFLKKIKFEIPESYDFHKLGLLVVDPYWIYAYWEIKQSVREDLIKRYGSDIINPDRLFLNVYDTGNNANAVLEIKVNSYKGNWFIHTNKPDSSFIAKLGFKDYNNNFIEVLCSNIVKTPRDRESENLEQLWAYLDIDKPISLDTKKFLKKYLKYKIKPDFVSSFGSIFGSQSFLKKK